MDYSTPLSLIKALLSDSIIFPLCCGTRVLNTDWHLIADTEEWLETFV